MTIEVPYPLEDVTTDELIAELKTRVLYSTVLCDEYLVAQLNELHEYVTDPEAMRDE